MIHHITPETPLTIARVKEIIDNHMTLALSDEASRRIQKCRDYLNKKMENQKVPIYGVTTGFGSLCNISISKEQLSQLQKNLVMSHACGVGDEVPQEVVRLMLLLKAQNFCFGYSGAQLQTVQRLIDCFNDDILLLSTSRAALAPAATSAPSPTSCSLPSLAWAKSIGKAAVAPPTRSIRPKAGNLSNSKARKASPSSTALSS